MIVFDVIGDVEGTVLVALLAELGQNADAIGFVVQGDISTEAQQLLDQIESLKVSDTIQNSWPGTTLLDGVGRVLEYQVSQSVLSAITGFSGRLFDWSRQSFPEDLFVRSGSTFLLETVGHERIALVRSEAMSPLLQNLVKAGTIIVHCASP